MEKKEGKTNDERRRFIEYVLYSINFCVGSEFCIVFAYKNDEIQFCVLCEFTVTLTHMITRFVCECDCIICILESVPFDSNKYTRLVA